MYSVLNICYAVTLEEKYWLMADLILPFAGLSFVMTGFCKPKRMDVGYKRLLNFHFFTYAVVSEIAFAVGDRLIIIIFKD